MTKHFSNQRREDTRPTSRETSTGHYREERSSRPARPRLSRDAVDRAWENGATRKYADYRPRQNAPMPPTQRQGRPAPAFERSQPPYERQTYGNRQDGRNGYGAPSSSFQNGRYPSSPRPRYPEAGSRRFNEPGQRAPGGQPALSSERWTRNPTPRRDSYRERYRDEQPPRFNRGGFDIPEQRGSYREERPRFDRSERERENFAHGKRSGAPRPRRDSSNPRWQSRPRPGAQREYPRYQGYQEPRRAYPEPYTRATFRPERPYERYGRPGEAQFEGDYEHFETDEYKEQPAPAYEKHITPLPDGRVVKGSRPAQRKQARFWTEVEEEAGNLLPFSPAHSLQHEQATQEAPGPQPKPTKTRKQPASRAHEVKTVQTTRAGKVGPRHAKAKVARKKAGTSDAGGQKSVLRPSQRGFKWPAAGE